MNEIKYPVIQAWIRADYKMQWVEVDAIDYLEETFTIVDENGDDRTFSLKEYDLRVSSEIVKKLKD